MKRYETLAAQITELIRDGSLRAGMQLPPVRQACAQFGVSPGTVFKAYYQLERKGLIRAVPRSGYFVCAPGAQTLCAAPSLRERRTPAALQLDTAVFDVLDSLREPGTVRFGSAFPDERLYPLARLARSMNHALREMPAAALTTELAAGSEALRRGISQRYLRRGMQVSHESIIVTDGALEALNLALEVLTSPGDCVIVERPCFYAVLQNLQRLHLRAVEVPVDPVHGLDLDIFEDALQAYPVKACWLMPTFHNPTGATLSEAGKVRLAELLSRHQVPLIEDDVYAELHAGTVAPAPVKAFDHSDLVLHCASFSKTLAPGYRVGWVAAPAAWRARLAEAKLMRSIATCVPAQWALADYLQRGHVEKHMRSLRRVLRERCNALRERLLQVLPRGTRVSAPDGGYFLWVELPPGCDALEIARRGQREGISVMPGQVFAASGGFANCLRVNAGQVWNAAAETALQRIAQWAHAAAADGADA